MAYLFLDDGFPEAAEYANNYIYFDENDPNWLQRVIKLVKQSRKNNSKTSLLSSTELEELSHSVPSVQLKMKNQTG